MLGLHALLSSGTQCWCHGADVTPVVIPPHFLLLPAHLGPHATAGRRCSLHFVYKCSQCLQQFCSNSVLRRAEGGGWRAQSPLCRTLFQTNEPPAQTLHLSPPAGLLAAPPSGVPSRLPWGLEALRMSRHSSPLCLQPSVAPVSMCCRFQKSRRWPTRGAQWVRRV